MPDATLQQLMRLIYEHFDWGEINELASRLGINDLYGRTTNARARELVWYLERHGRLSELLMVLSEERPDLNLSAFEELAQPLPILVLGPPLSWLIPIAVVVGLITILLAINGSKLPLPVQTEVLTISRMSGERLTTLETVVNCVGSELKPTHPSVPNFENQEIIWQLADSSGTGYLVNIGDLPGTINLLDFLAVSNRAEIGFELEQSPSWELSANSGEVATYIISWEEIRQQAVVVVHLPDGEETSINVDYRVDVQTEIVESKLTPCNGTTSAVAILNVATLPQPDGSTVTTAELSLEPIGVGNLELAAPSTMDLGESVVSEIVCNQKTTTV